MHRRLIAALGSVLILLAALIWSRGDRPAEPPTKVKLPKALGAIQPRLSPDGSTVAFSYQGEIWTGPRAGGTMTLLTPSRGLDTEPAWSPDGKRIAFLRGAGVKVVLFPDGKDVPLPKPVSAGGTYAVSKLEFSADGKRLLGAFRVGEANRLAWFDLESGELAPLVAASSYFRFALSPDGKWIVHTSIPDQPGEQSGNNGSHTDLWKLPASPAASAPGDKAEKVCRFPARVHDLCWADGGSLIVAAELGQAHDDLWRVPLADPLRGMVKLTSGQADEDRPCISRDGKWLVYTDNRSGPTELVVREMAGGEESTVRFDTMDYRRPTGTLRLTVKDSAGGKSTVRESLFGKTGADSRPGRRPTSGCGNRAWPGCSLISPRVPSLPAFPGV
jgi:dipeptidyl aminopeptidase/acylaminoacyl peptidase